MVLACGAARASTVAFKSEKYYTKCIGHSFIFFAPLRSGNYGDTNSVYHLLSDGSLSVSWAYDWLAVRPAHELTRISHSERSEESQSKLGHFTKVQCDKVAFKGIKYYT